MIQALLNKMPLLYFVCGNCYALIKYNIQDVPLSQQIKCPVCGEPNKVNFNPSYQGVVRMEEDGSN